jgi:hypothetical protein
MQVVEYTLLLKKTSKTSCITDPQGFRAFLERERVSSNLSLKAFIGYLRVWGDWKKVSTHFKLVLNALVGVGTTHTRWKRINRYMDIREITDDKEKERMVLKSKSLLLF